MTQTAQFRKKPVVINAWHVKTREQARGTSGICTGGLGCVGHGPEDSWPHVHSLEGDHTWTPGDWLIRGVKGEFYFCKPDIFAATYEPVVSSSATAKESWPRCFNLSNTGVLHPNAKPPCNGKRCERCDPAPVSAPAVSFPDPNPPTTEPAA